MLRLFDATCCSSKYCCTYAVQSIPCRRETGNNNYEGVSIARWHFLLFIFSGGYVKLNSLFLCKVHLLDRTCPFFIVMDGLLSGADGFWIRKSCSKGLSKTNISINLNDKYSRLRRGTRDRWRFDYAWYIYGAATNRRQPFRKKIVLYKYLCNRPFQHHAKYMYDAKICYQIMQVVTRFGVCWENCLGVSSIH